MASRYYYHILSTLLITNRLFPVWTETVLGEQIDEEFDFDGKPGVQHEFKVEVPSGKEECFHQFVPLRARFYISFEVVRGGDWNINFFVYDSEHHLIDSHYSTTQGRSEDIVTSPGYYQICFDNTYSRYGSKLVYFYLVTIVMDEWNKYMDDVAEIQGLAVNFTAILTGVQMSLVDVGQYQIHTHLNVIRDWYLIAGNNRYIGYWSMAQCIIIISAAMGQVFFLRRLFTVARVTPTLKPRA